MPTFHVTAPDGKTYEVAGPDGATAEQALAQVQAHVGQSAAQTATPAAQADEPFPVKLGRQVWNAATGAVRGAGSIGATLIASPSDIRTQLFGSPNGILPQPKTLSSLVAPAQPTEDQQRRQAMTDALAGLGADTNSFAFGAGKLGGEVAGTAGVGGAAANVLGHVLPALATRAAPVLDAISSGGFSAGGAKGLPAVAARVVGGAVTGGASAGLVDPSSAGGGALVGAALPPALQVGGVLGRALAAGWRSIANPSAAAADDLARALGALTPQQRAEAVQRLRGAETLVPGSTPTVAQAMMTPEASITQRVVYDSPGGAALRNKLAQQGDARLGALENVAPTVPTGYRSAQQDMGETIARNALAGDAAARAKTNALYQAVPQDEAALYLPDLGSVRDKYFGPGSFTSRAAADKAVSTAQQIGTTELPAVTASSAGAAPPTLAQAVRKAGGISIVDHDGLRGELVGLRGDVKNLLRTNGGMTPGRMAEAMHEAGYLPNEDAATLLQALRDDATGLPQFSMRDDISRMAGAGRDAAMGAPPGAERIPQKVTLREFDNLRKSIGAEQRGAARDPARAAEAASLTDMKKALDDRLNEVVRGDGAMDENLPIAWANGLDAARQAKVDQVARFRTGPQASIFRTGADGQPAVQGGEVAAKFWGSRPGVADDVKSFRRLVDDNPKLLGQFRSMVTTEGAGTADAAGNLTTKFSKWVAQTLPGLRETFDAKEVQTLQRIAADIDRAAAAQKLGTSLGGSNTYQNSANALNLGLLDSPLVSKAANMIPGVRLAAAPLLEGGRAAMRNAKATRLAGLLADSGQAANALAAPSQSYPRVNALNQALLQNLLRVGPIAQVDR